MTTIAFFTFLPRALFKVYMPTTTKCSRGALFVTEFGGGYSTDAQNLVPTLNGQDTYMVTGATVWVSSDVGDSSM